MLLTAEEFAAGAKQLAAVCHAHLPSEPAWQWVPCRAPFATGTGGGYLARQHALAAPQPAQQQQLSAAGAAQQPADGAQASCCSSSDVGSIPEEEHEEEDPADARLAATADGGSRAFQPPRSALQADVAAAAAAAAARDLSLACHIAYHPSYQVPALYLEAAGRDGAPVGLPALLAALPRLREAVEGGQPYTVLTQEEHPFLRRPWFMLHPCQTAAVMQLLTEPPSGADPTSAIAVAPQPAAAVAPQPAAAVAPQPAAEAAAAVAPQPAAEPAARHGGAEMEEHAAAAAPAGHGQAARPCPLRYLLAWLSVVGQPLGIPVPPDLWQRCRSSC